MKPNNRVWIKAYVLLVVILICSCSLPGSATSQEVSLLQTVQALNTTVAGQGASTPIPETAATMPAVELPTATATLEFTTTPIAHSLTPGQPDWVARWFTDTDSSRTANEKRAPGGDNFSKNIYERPFTANDMTFRPDLDINKAEISSDSNFIYFTIYLKGVNPQTNNLQGMYGAELDTDFDGRGNYLVLASNPSGTDWKMENVTVYKDSGKKVGGARAMSADAPNGYVGYDQTIFSLQNLSDPDAAWGRVSPKGSGMVEVAVKKSLIGGGAQFLWSIWADDGVKDAAKYDYNDHFTSGEAGSPYQDSEYPLKALALVDSTCREIFNFTPTADIPGLCALPATATPTLVPTVPTNTPTSPPSPGNITGSIFGDYNGNGHRDADDIPFCGGMTLSISIGACGSGGAGIYVPITGSCTFSINGLVARDYCLEGTGVDFTTPSTVTVTVPAGGTTSVEFGMRAVY